VTASGTDAGGRQLAVRTVDWERLLRPQCVAVIGATDREGTQQRAQTTQIRDRLGIAGGAQIAPVHPTKTEILDLKAYPDIGSVPFDVDLAIILIRDALPAVEQCLAAGVKFCVVFSAGFSEVGTAEGDAAAARLAELSSGPMRIMGPNTNLNLFEPWPGSHPGKKLAIVSQSGYQGRPITQGQVLGIGIEAWATVGNEADLEWADFVAYFSGLSSVGAIASYVEGFQNGRSFQLAADAAARNRVPIVVIKVGRTDEGRAMAAAHTGHLTGADAVHDAVFEQYGVIRVDDIDEVIEISGMFCHTGLVPGEGGVAVYAMSGGTASHVADLCSTYGVPVPTFSEETIDALGELLPWYLRRDNPVDSGGVITAKPENRTVLELMLADPNVDILFAPITGVFPGMSDALARDLIALHQAGGKPIVTAWISPQRDDQAYRDLCAAGVPMFHSFSAAARGLAELGRFSRLTRDYRSPFDGVINEPSRVADEARALVRTDAVRDEVGAKTLLNLYGIPTVPEIVATTAAEAAAAAASLGLPVVMKVLSPDIQHKSDLGLVEIGLADEASVLDCYARFLDIAAERAPDASVSGVVLQALITDAVAETILGISHQEPFGPTVLFGLGGVLTELLKDVSFGVPPYGEEWARRMVDSTAAGTLLRGFRGRPAGDVDALITAIVALGRLAAELGDDLAELDINPLLVLPRGRGVVAVDALVMPR
jgi:acyl-CoA synthetase (NDP forming)